MSINSLKTVFPGPFTEFQEFRLQDALQCLALEAEFLNTANACKNSSNHFFRVSQCFSVGVVGDSYLGEWLSAWLAQTTLDVICYTFTKGLCQESTYLFDIYLIIKI